MSGYDEAKAQRNTLERLGDKIPGFRGFQDRELRRDVDRLQREHLAGEVTRLKGQVRELARAYTDAGQIGALSAFDRLDRQLDGLSQQIRFADYGATGLFDPVKINEAELQRLYDYDLSVLGDLAGLDAAAAAVPGPGVGDPGGPAGRLLDGVRALAEKWRRREEVIGTVVQTGRS
jgi:hypothetical protein